MKFMFKIAALMDIAIGLWFLWMGCKELVGS